ncbi:prepilin-type N-terminal cleavage/methylation domain-containing protein [bacterium]|nr:prepilin-type N-terminal cleavage/methylation domain-containing protein [bacterium]
MKLSAKRAARGFTLIELLTVVAVVLILAALIMTSVFSAQEAGRVTVCRNNLKQLHKLVLLYTTTYGGYLPSFWHERWVGEMALAGGQWPPGNKPHDKPFKARLRDPDTNVEYIEPAYVMPQVWNNVSSPNPLVYTGQMPNRSGAPVILCPSDTSQYICDQGPQVSYLGLAKYGWWHRAAGGNIYWTDKPMMTYHQMQEFDSTSKRIMFMESEPGTWQLGGCGCRWHAYRHPVWIVSRHYGGGNVLFFDGHVELCKGARSQVVTLVDGSTMQATDNMIRYWEPDYDVVNPGW